MKNRRIRVLIETNGQIPNYEGHVRGPLALIIAAAFTDTVEPAERIWPKQIEFEHRDSVVLEEDTLVAVTIETGHDRHHIRDVAELTKRIAGSIHQSGMFRCRYTPGTVRLEIHLNVYLPIPESA